MYNCESLQKIDLSGLTNLTTIGDEFMHYCYNLQEINLSRLTNLKSIGNDFMEDCYGLRKIILTKEYYDKYDEQVNRRLLRYEAILEFV